MQTIEVKNTKKYEKIASQIETMIVTSSMIPGDRLLSIMALAQHFNVAAGTITSALDLLRNRGVVVGNPMRKGFFVGKLCERSLDRTSAADLRSIGVITGVPRKAPAKSDDLFWFSEENHPLGRPLPASRKTLSVYLPEYRYANRKAQWDELMDTFRHRGAPTNFRVLVKPEQAAEADILLYSDDPYDRHAPDILSGDGEARRCLRDPVRMEDYFPVAKASLHGNERAALPFAVSQAMRFVNREVWERHCPDLDPGDGAGAGLIAAFKERRHHRDPAFPVLGTFISALPLLLLEEGVDIYDFETGAVDFSSPRVLEALEFNRAMVEKLRSRLGDRETLSFDRVWKMFIRGEVMLLDDFSYMLPLLDSESGACRVMPSPAAARWPFAVARTQLLGIGRACREPLRAAEFIRFACGPEGQTRLAERRDNIPALRVCAYSHAFLGSGAGVMEPSLLRELEHPRSLLDQPVLSSVFTNSANSIVWEYYAGRAESAATLRRLQELATAVLSV